MKFAKWVFRIAGVYGIIVILPLYFSENMISSNFPPAITHPEYFYGFIGVTLAWQILFLFLSRDPVKHRVLMLPAILEKATYGIAVLWLLAQQRVAGFALDFAMLDLILGALFLVAYLKTAEESR